MNEDSPEKGWVYLDNNATTRMDVRVVDAMLPMFRENFANPSSAHALGVAAADAVRESRSQVQRLVGAASASELIFTSGGSESNTAAILSALYTQAGRDEIVTSTVEHPAILSVCAHLERTGAARIHRIPVDQSGRLNIEEYRRALSEKTALVTLQWANNETGVLFPIERLAAMAHQAGALFHSDAVQAAGKVSIDVVSAGIDMLTLSAHKMHGPKGIGGLYLRNGVRFASLIHGGRQERGRRAGTENAAAIVGFGVAAEIAAQALTSEMQRIGLLRDRLEREMLRFVPGSILVGDRGNRLPNTLNIAFEDAEADSILLLLERAFIAASSGSACATGSMEPSHVLRAMKVPFSHLRGSVRFSFSRENSETDVDRVLECAPRIVQELRACSEPLEAA
jgi:cysteine desulfurase